MYKNIIKVIAIIWLNLGGFDTYDLHSQNMQKHRWENRILIVYTSNQESLDYQNQLKALADANEEMRERKLVLYELDNQNYKYTDFESKKNNESWQVMQKPLPVNFNASDSFKVFLIGLDGGVKLERSDPLRPEALFRVIDSMPMRISELEKR